MLYELTLFIPNGSYHAILEKPSVHNGYIQGTIVAECTDLNNAGNPVYTRIYSPYLTFVGGTYILKEYTGKIKEF